MSKSANKKIGHDFTKTAYFFFFFKCGSFKFQLFWMKQNPTAQGGFKLLVTDFPYKRK